MNQDMAKIRAEYERLIEEDPHSMRAQVYRVANADAWNYSDEELKDTTDYSQHPYAQAERPIGQKVLQGGEAERRDFVDMMMSEFVSQYGTADVDQNLVASLVPGLDVFDPADRQELYNRVARAANLRPVEQGGSAHVSSGSLAGRISAAMDRSDLDENSAWVREMHQMRHKAGVR